MAVLKPPVHEGDHMQGKIGALITLVEYGDFQCEHCKEAHPIVKKILSTYKNNLLFVFRHFPLLEVHPYARLAAMVAEAAGRQNKFWEMHDLLFENQALFSKEETIWIELAKTLDLDIVKFRADLYNPVLQEKIESDFKSGIISGVNGTPSFFINGKKFNGPSDFKSLTEAMITHLGVK